MKTVGLAGTALFNLVAVMRLILAVPQWRLSEPLHRVSGEAKLWNSLVFARGSNVSTSGRCPNYKIAKEAAGIHDLLTGSLFGDDILRR